MSNAKTYMIWTWIDEDGVPFYVGWGKMEIAHPAKRVWARRNSVTSDLTIALRTYKREPKRGRKDSSLVPLTRAEASGIAVARREQYKSDGIAILSDREHGTKVGGGAGRAIMGPEFEVYNSVREAAAAYGVNPSTITRWARRPGSDFDYVN
jgi:hypothetical protein